MQHSLRSHSFVQFLLDRNETTQTQKWGADLCHSMPNSKCWGTHDIGRLFCPPRFQLLFAKIQLLYHFPAALTFSSPKLWQNTTNLILSYFAAAHGNVNSCNDNQKDWSLSTMPFYQPQCQCLSLCSTACSYPVWKKKKKKKSKFKHWCEIFRQIFKHCAAFQLFLQNMKSQF